ncbi:phage protein (plasmid) [Vibrio parahaemolyticus]|uniref:phage protein n=1 Tax=Vibrio harveyi group TaxID=717610 RepID=UPI00084BAED1|nr:MULTISPECIES: phage protein [Vibrio harveyi group]EGR3413953.1 regulator [Vibrio parahaemolyticus]EID7698246.1 phage protein [Vibrio parahaemolyticus]EJG1425727.1 phage protein [Vibrio parahaemolyticus]ELB2062934.1 phage protein [Vibrio parahaemolyticus]MCS0366042.1 phage protein [Vibrio diabolicus]
MKYHEMTKNYIFREFECGLSVEQAAELCLKTVRTVKEWDKGKTIPPECKRLMRMSKGRELSTCKEWENFTMRHDRLELPTGQRLSPQQILIGAALLDIQSELEIKTSTQLLKLSRALIKIKT